MCGIFGAANHPQAVYSTYLGLHALQHRGEEACGIVSSNGRRLFRVVASGLVSEGLRRDKIKTLKGSFSIGHVRYSTSGGSIERNAQPLMAHTAPWGDIAIAHNGNIPGYKKLRSEMQKKGALFHTDSDTETLLVAIGQAVPKISNDPPRSMDMERFAQSLQKALLPIEGAFSLLLLTKHFFVALRDPWGVRPLSLGRVDKSWVVSSETNAFDLVGARFEREIKPGEILIISHQGIMKSFPLNPSMGQPPTPSTACIFELVYFSRPDSHILGRNVYPVRREMGRQLAREAPVPQADLVIAIPDSANVQALGYAEEAGLPCEEGLIRSHYIGRTFIAPRQDIRDFNTKLKYSPVRSLLHGKRIVVVDDSIVRGTTSKKIISLLRELGGAKEVHLRVASPPIVSPCFYGIDMPTRKELVAAKFSVPEIKKFLGVDSLSYLSLDGMLAACGAKQNEFCHACFSGKYQIAAKTIAKELGA